MAYTTINKSTDYFNTVTFTGNGSLPRAITGVGHQPDWVWLKDRDTAYNHQLYDIVRGTSAGVLYSNSNSLEDSTYQMASFNSDGYTMGSNMGAVNDNNKKIVSWNWRAGNSAGSTNNDGNVATTVSVNTTAGFSIVTYTGTGNAGATIGHGLGAVPNMIIVKKRAGGSARDWAVYHSANTSAPETEILYLNNNDGTADSSAYWYDTAPTSSVITLGAGNEVNESNTHTYVAYCFAEKKGYSKFGSYTGNGNASGTFVYTGLKPSFVLVKRTDTNGYEWSIWDNKRDPFNLADTTLRPNSSATESTIGSSYQIDMLSQGFKFRTNNGDVNASGGTYIYMAFGQSIVGSNNISATAR